MQSKHFKRQVTTIQPLSTFPVKGLKAIFNLKEISVKGLYPKLIFIRKINGIGLRLN
jgi:hypothetical protein